MHDAPARRSQLTLAVAVVCAVGCSDAAETPTDPCGADVPSHLNSGLLDLSGTDTVTLGAGPCKLSRLCVRDQAALIIADSAKLVLTGDAPSVVLGRGVASKTSATAKLDLTLATAAPAFLRLDTTVAPIELRLDATQSDVTILLEGTSGLTIDGPGAATTIYGGDPTTFPACP